MAAVTRVADGHLALGGAPAEAWLGAGRGCLLEEGVCLGEGWGCAELGKKIAGLGSRWDGPGSRVETDETAGLTEERVRSLIGVAGLAPALLGVLEERERLVVTCGGLRRGRAPRA